MWTFEVYEDKAKLWRWRLKAGNGKIIADSAEAYDSKSNVKRAVSTVKWGMRLHMVRVVEA